ncbi:5'-nucleotidase [Chania multitudinisentens RB-25]|uniref:5'-nucleotidase n=1 Tax=Chania multitudinisentens RB-25 TaxID=1441930 RepID=W0LF65_9GAMM|nr:5'/3'-nucleotidase SurE [Chania multitudinisentens]AHG21034.1 5'-nucleotidase [Chania multitudinisentens RB-25]
MKKILTLSALLLAMTATSTFAAERPMRILIVNDDGCEAYGTVSLREKLEKKGYDVWISAPSNNQSGIGSAITMKKEPFEYKKLGDKHYCFPGTPADSLDFGLLGFMRDNPPDLVISGVNDGPNTGVAQVNSGTVGAAARAVRYGYPAIAASIGWNTDELAKFKGFPSTKKYWPDSVDYVVDMVDVLAKNWQPGQEILPKGTGLSINYPAYPKNEIKGVKYIINENFPYPQHSYKMLPDNKTIQVLNPEVLKVDTRDTDTGWLHQRYITYTIIDASWNAEQFESAYKQRLNDPRLLKMAQ